MDIPSLNFHTNSLYLLLLDRGDDCSFHWGLYLAKSPTHGDAFHLINPDNPNSWKYEFQPNHNVLESKLLLLALEVADLDPVLHDALGERLSEIPIQYSTRFREDMTSRVWIKEALFALDDEGYISIGSIDAIENDAKLQAMMNKHKAQRTITHSKSISV